MKITREEVEYVARLAHIDLDNNETERITKQLDEILSYVAKLDAIDTADIKVISPQASSNVFREDEVGESLERSDALANCSRQNGETFLVPRIL